MKNYDVASKIMKINAILEIIIDMHNNKNIIFGTIVSDDDSYAKIWLVKNKRKWKEENNGRHLLPIYLICFLADPNYCKKVDGILFYEMATVSQKVSEIDKLSYKDLINYIYRVRLRVSTNPNFNPNPIYSYTSHCIHGNLVPQFSP